MRPAPFAPMLAVPLEKAEVTNWNDWSIEEKFDGVRLIVEVTGDLEDGQPSYITRGVYAWTRPRKHAGSDGKTMASRQLPDHLMRAFAELPAGVYDGELLAGDTSTDVTRTDLQHELRFVVFDVLRLLDMNATRLTYTQRRALLQDMNAHGMFSGPLTLATSHPLTCQDDVSGFVNVVWKRGGEGAIIKRNNAPYAAGKRSPAFVKVKKLNTTVCTVVGFEATRGTVMNRGQYAKVLLEDVNGNRTSVKTKDDLELAKFNKHTGSPATHPALGRKLRIEYQDWTPRGGYRHPRWDRWEDE